MRPLDDEDRRYRVQNRRKKIMHIKKRIQRAVRRIVCGVILEVVVKKHRQLFL